MSRANRIKLFLLSNIDYREDVDRPRHYLSALFSLLRRNGPRPGDEVLDGSRVFYRESEGDSNLFDVNALEAVDMARGLSMTRITRFSRTRTLEHPAGAVQVHDIASELLYDPHASFLLVTEVTLTLSGEADLPSTVSAIFAGRTIGDNLKIGPYLDEAFADAAAEAARLLKEKDPRTPIDTANLLFCEENTLPLLLCEPGLEQPPREFRNEERLSGIPHEQSLGHEYPGGFFHPGWNYTLACGFPFEAFMNIVQVMIRCQTFFFSLTQIKRYFASEFSHTLRGRETIDQREVDDAEQVRLAFYDLLSQFNGFKNKLYPKYYDEAERLLSRWHCDSDIEHIKEYIDLNFQAKSRLHNLNVERQNERQNKALAFIAVLQVITLYGAFGDGLALLERNHTWFALGTATWLITLYAFLLLSGYLKTAVVFTLALTGVGLAMAWGFFA